jgi:hypothetical protein
LFSTVPNTGREFFTSDKARCTSSASFPLSEEKRPCRGEGDHVRRVEQRGKIKNHDPRRVSMLQFFD